MSIGEALCQNQKHIDEPKWKIEKVHLSEGICEHIT